MLGAEAQSTGGPDQRTGAQTSNMLTTRPPLGCGPQLGLHFPSVKGHDSVLPLQGVEGLTAGGPMDTQRGGGLCTRQPRTQQPRTQFCSGACLRREGFPREARSFWIPAFLSERQQCPSSVLTDIIGPQD